MARWRAAAIEHLPTLRHVVASADSPMALWIDLRLAFERAYEADPRDEALIAGVYAFADWCVQAPRRPDAGHDPLTAVVVAFYEHVPAFAPARDDMPRWFRHADVAQNRPMFAYHVGDEAYGKLVAFMGKNEHRYLTRPTVRYVSGDNA
jgi:hypothetical protein